MKGLTQVGATPARVAILFGLVTDAGHDGLERSRLEAMATPASLTDAEEAGVDNALRHALNAGLDMGLFSMEGGRLHSSQDSADFAEVAETLTLSRPADINTEDGWLAGAVAWLLCQDPLQPLPFGTSAAVNRLRAQLGPSGLLFGITNDSRWQNLVYWARALGYAERGPDNAVVSDPTRAIERHLDRALPSGVQRALPAFLNDLAELSPVLDGGRHRREVERATGVIREPTTISASLELALLRLKLRGSLTFLELSDAERILINRRDNIYATHVSRGAGQ